ncbi:hypothetical protein IV203_025921 [Nitzschia inconspicua]|uniref:Uncharacterized protein n=1 Tax=Nitzschia inconspicua TaxID=303405 RepID=A0A9K3PAK3_9STRA|nr:hypothetical protein IV203_017766 [Nitzschia inconspicua]KAG7362255.1 hypothetical protein IV203_025921 [Nitzschia inconspicua]
MTDHLYRARLVGLVAVSSLLLLTGVVAFVRHHFLTLHPKRPSIQHVSFLQASTDDLKGLLDASSYESDVVKAYAGKTIKTAARKSSKPSSSSSAYDLSVDDSIKSSPTSPPVDATSTISPPPIDDIKSEIVHTATPTLSDPSPPISEQIKTVTESIKEEIGSSTGNSNDLDTKNPLEGITVPSNVQEVIEKPFAPLNNILKSTQESIKEAQRVAAEQSAAASAASDASGSSSASGKVPTMADYMLKSLSNGKASLGTATEKSAVKLPDMPNIQIPSVDGVVRSPQSTDITLPEPGKALTFGEYVRAKVTGSLPDDGSSTVSTMADIKEKLGIMATNYYKLIGKEVPDSLEGFAPPTMQDFANLSNKVASFDFKQFVDSLPESAPLAALAMGTLLVVAGARKDAPPSMDTKSMAPQTMEAATEALGGLSEDLESLQLRMKTLEATGLSLQAELRAAKEKLLEKELEISKERLKVADNKLTLNREVQKLEEKLKVNDVQVKSLDKELAKTRDESEALRKALEEAKGTTTTKAEPPATEVVPVASVADVVQDLPSANGDTSSSAPKKKAPTKKKAASKKTAVKAASVKEPVAKAAAVEEPVAKTTTSVEEPVVEATSTVEEPVAKATKIVEETAVEATSTVEEPVAKTTTKKAATKKAAAKKKEAPKAKEEPPTVFFAEEVKASEPAPSKKAAAKKAAAKKATTKKPETGGSNDWASLSKSTISRKTVKELSEYLDSKGVATTDAEGNALKKADLVEAILSL